MAISKMGLTAHPCINTVTVTYIPGRGGGGYPVA